MCGIDFFEFDFKFKKMPRIPSKIGQGVRSRINGIPYSTSVLR